MRKIRTSVQESSVQEKKCANKRRHQEKIYVCSRSEKKSNRQICGQVKYISTQMGQVFTTSGIQQDRLGLRKVAYGELNMKAWPSAALQEEGKRVVVAKL